MTTRINKQVRIVTDTNFNNNKILNAKISASENDISGVTKVDDVKVNGTSVVTSKIADISIATVAQTGDYSDLNNKPSIPIVNDSTITIKQNGQTKGSFTLNQDQNSTIELDETGALYPKNNNDLKDILENNDNITIDFTNYNDDWDEDGYEIENKNLKIKNLSINNNQNFDYFQKTLFKFINCQVELYNCKVLLDDIDCQNSATLYPAFQFMTNNYNENYNEVSFYNSNLSVHNPTNVNAKMVVANLTDCKMYMENSGGYFGTDGNGDYGTLFEFNVSNEVDDGEKVRVMIMYSTLETWGFNISDHCIEYTNGSAVSGARIDFSQLQSSNESIIITDGTEIYTNFSKLSNVTCIASSEQFTFWQTETVYNEGDNLRWIEHYDEAELSPTVGITYNEGTYIFYNDNMWRLRQNSECTSPIQEWLWENADYVTNNRFFKVVGTFKSNSDYNNTWNDFSGNWLWNGENSKLSWYYNVTIHGEMYLARDLNNRISNFEVQDNKLRVGELEVFNSLYTHGRFQCDDTIELNGHLQCNDTNNFYIKMQDTNINSGNDTDVLSAISELASRVKTLEDNP